MEPKYRIIGLCILLLSSTWIQAQQVLIRGRIIDKQTGGPVISASIKTTPEHGTKSDSEGRFRLTVGKFPVTLTVSHVSYGIREVPLSKPAGEVVIRLEAIVNKIPEVRISSSRNPVQILNRKARYTIIDYQFEGKYMWFIGCLDNSPKKERLFLGDPYGDTICSIPVVKDARLYRDYFGKIHLIRPDTVFQLFAAEDSILLVYPERKENFMSLMTSFEVAFQEGLARLAFDQEQEQLSLIYKDSTLKAPRRIYLDRSADTSYLEKRYAWMGRYFGPRTLDLIINQQKRYYHQKMRSFLFTLADSLYIINLTDDQLHVLDESLKEIRVIPLKFYFKDTGDITDAYVFFRMITDPVKHKAYVIFNINSHYTITPFDTHTGQIGPELLLPRYSAMDKISINDNALYYIYPEKTYPYYQRLFRMSLD